MTTHGADTGSPLSTSSTLSEILHVGSLLRRDWVLQTAAVVCGLLIGYQLCVTLLAPPWIGPVTDWLRAALAWVQLLVVVLVAVWLTRHRAPGAAMGWAVGAGFLSYAIGRTLWTLADQLIYAHGVPFPSLPDLFFALQYPCFVVAFLLVPSLPFWPQRLHILLDGVLVVGSAAALTWYFVLEPLYVQSGISSLARFVTIWYLTGDLVLLACVTRLFFRRTTIPGAHAVVALIALAIISLFFADALAALALLPPPHVFHAGTWPDLFWMIFYLLVPFALLLYLHLVQRATVDGVVREEQPRATQRIYLEDLLASLRLMLPLLVALLASLAIELKAVSLLASVGIQRELAPFAVGTGLLLLVIVRQVLVFIEHEQLRREQAATQAAMLALRDANQRMEAFLNIASHELKTPLTSLWGNVMFLSRRLSLARQQDEDTSDQHALMTLALTVLDRCNQSLRRMAQLVNDMLDDARAQQGQLAVHLERGDLAHVVATVVEEQRQLAAERRIELDLPPTQPVIVQLDSDRIAQVLMNYLSNALKYSGEERPVLTRLELTDGEARVSVHDEGVGVPLSAEAHIWDRFYRVEGVKVQSGSGIGLGIGLHVSKAIVEAHHGRVGMERNSGPGSTFWFTLPLCGNSDH